MVFHLCLLAILLLAAIGQLTSLQARIEITEGQGFDHNQLQQLRKGPWHPYKALQKISFQQAAVQVNYRPGLIRGSTRSGILITPSDDEPSSLTVGDNIPLRISGYRFYTSSNKGFAVLLSWLGEDGSEQSGSVNLPSYPLNDWQLKRSWTTPSGEEIEFQYKLDKAAPTQQSWVLTQQTGAGVLTANIGVRSYQLARGKWIGVKAGKLRFDDVRVWMGYEVFYNPILPWLFAAAFVGICGLSAHFWGKFRPHSEFDKVHDEAPKTVGENRALT